MHRDRKCIHGCTGLGVVRIEDEANPRTGFLFGATDNTLELD